MTARLDALNMLYRDFKAADDVAKMKELRQFAVEFTVYGCRFWADGQAKFLLSSQRERVVAFLHQRANFGKRCLPMEAYTLRTSVPAGSEEAMWRLAKLQLTKRLRDCYDEAFLEGLRALDELSPDGAAEGILDELMDKLEGLFCLESLLLFEGLLDKACRAKHVRAEAQERYEQWLSGEYRQLAAQQGVTDQFVKRLHGLAYMDGQTMKRYCNAESAKAYEKQAQLLGRQILVSAVYSQSLWYNYEVTPGELRARFEAQLAELFDEDYFAYLRRLDQLPSRVSAQAFDAWQAANGDKGEEIRRALACYRLWWGVKES